MTAFIAYYRVSTHKQGRSGLGLEAQTAAATKLVAQRGGEILAAYEEIETGTGKRTRPELAKALAHARRAKAILVIAKLDRLARNVAFVSALMEGNVEFVCCDVPSATPFTIHILAAVAEEEARLISKRTKDALAARKARGLPLGAADPRCKSILEIEGAWGNGQQLGSQRNKEGARKAVADLLPIIASLRTQGQSLRQIAARLNLLQHRTRLGKPWNPTQVKRVLDRESTPCATISATY